MFNRGKRAEPEPPGWFADRHKRFDSRYVDKYGDETGGVAIELWDPMSGRDPDAEFWLPGPTGVLSLARNRIVILSRSEEGRRGSSRLILPRDACHLALDRADDDLWVTVRFELGAGESPTLARGKVYLRVHQKDEAELRRFITWLQPGQRVSTPQARPGFLRIDAPAVEPVELVEEVPASTPVEVPEPAPPPPPPPSSSTLPRLAVRTVPDSADWICFRPGPSIALVTEARPEVVRP